MAVAHPSQPAPRARHLGADQPAHVMPKWCRLARAAAGHQQGCPGDQYREQGQM